MFCNNMGESGGYCAESEHDCIQLIETPSTVAHQALLSVGFPRQEYWSGLPFPPSGDLPDPEIEPTPSVSPVLQVDSSSLVRPDKSPEDIIWSK